uniref:Uncharacterized protein n=1 Tax=Glossina austeni TaxID=7395 RepID=A0A1A9VL58_GLOAU
MLRCNEIITDVCNKVKFPLARKSAIEFLPITWLLLLTVGKQINFTFASISHSGNKYCFKSSLESNKHIDAASRKRLALGLVYSLEGVIKESQSQSRAAQSSAYRGLGNKKIFDIYPSSSQAG